MAANPERGEVDFMVNGRLYTLKLSMNAAVRLERKLNKRIGQILTDAGALNFESVRSLVWLLLQKHHAEEFKTEESAGDLIDDAGGIAGFFALLQQLVDVNKPEGGDGSSNPPPAAQTPATSGTGEPSTSTLAATV